MQLLKRCPDCGEEITHIEATEVRLESPAGMIRTVTVKKYRCRRCDLRVIVRHYMSGTIISAYLLDPDYQEFTHEG